MKLYIVRHGETNENAAGIVQGWLDTELNERGLVQAHEAAAAFNRPIDVIYSSDLKRAVRTAQEFRVSRANAPYFEDARLRERNFGDAAGTHRDSIDWEQLWSIKEYAAIPNAESVNEFAKRLESFLDDLKKKPYESVLVVAHGGVLNQVQTILDPTFIPHTHANASILELTI